MSNASKIVSAAFNFGQQFSAGVNTRTGIYQLVISLGQLGADFQLKTAYNHLSMANEGFGIGWSLNVSRYDRAQRRLTLSDGRSYRVSLSRFKAEVECQYLKLQDIKVTHQNEQLKVSFKDGTVELFDSEGYLRSVTAASGHMVTFTYRGGRLEKITNHSNLSLMLAYDQSGVTITSANHRERVRVRVSGRITDVFYPDNTTYQIRYRSINGLYVIEYLEHPTGAIEKLTYNENGMRLPAAGPVSNLPAVSMHEIYGSDVPRMTRTYRYSSNNFLGHGLSRYIPDVDNLFETASNYTYSCTETFGSKEITQTYNKYHLLVEEAIRELPGRQVMQKTTMEYYADTNKGFVAQSMQYLLPRKQVTTYYNSAGNSRSEVSESEFDIYGNELRKVDAFGVQTHFDYYPAEGEDGLAPAAPVGIPFLLKRQTTTPSARKLQGGEVAQIATYTYVLHPSLQAGMRYPVKASETISTVQGRDLSATTFTYVNNPTEPECHGAPLRVVTIEGALEKCDDYTYMVHRGVSLSTIVTSQFQDGISYTEEQESCLYLGLPLSMKDRVGNQTKKEYDGLGRVTREVTLVGSKFEKTTAYHYEMNGHNQLNIDISDGTRRRVGYDALGRERANYATDSAGQLVLMSQQHYNSQGQVATRITYDDFGAGEVAVATHLRYDIWGEVCEERYASGQVSVTERDKAKNAQTQYIKAGGQHGTSAITYYDERGKVVQEAHSDFNVVITYNGLGEEIKRKNAFDVETTLELDDIGRVQRELVGYIAVNKTFVADNRELVTKLAIAGKTIGNRQYDSLGRVISEAKEGLTTHYRYHTLTDKPSVVT
ncbi:hypothetical protein QMX34_004753, partial [Aeromonas hydrophila]|nr:hypothetical protein [Aeromonas hydrophila]